MGTFWRFRFIGIGCKPFGGRGAPLVKKGVAPVVTPERFYFFGEGDSTTPVFDFAFQFL